MVEVLLKFMIDRLWGIFRLCLCVMEIVVVFMLLLLVKIVVGGWWWESSFLVVVSLEW